MISTPVVSSIDPTAAATTMSAISKDSADAEAITLNKGK